MVTKTDLAKLRDASYMFASKSGVSLEDRVTDDIIGLPGQDGIGGHQPVGFEYLPVAVDNFVAKTLVDHQNEFPGEETVSYLFIFPGKETIMGNSFFETGKKMVIFIFFLKHTFFYGRA